MSVRVTLPRRAPGQEDVISFSESPGPSSLRAQWGPGSLRGAVRGPVPLGACEGWRAPPVQGLPFPSRRRMAGLERKQRSMGEKLCPWGRSCAP